MKCSLTSGLGIVPQYYAAQVSKIGIQSDSLAWLPTF